MRELRLRSPFALLGLAGLLLASCGQRSASGDPDGTGSVGLGLQISPGNVVSEATFTISGPNDFESAGTVGVGDDPNVPVVVNNLPLGVGYEMDVTATASDGTTTCEGTATFDVTDSSTSTIIVHLVCGVPSGDLNITGAVNVCPVLDSLGASPNQVVLGGTMALTSSAHDTDSGPLPLSYTWTANGAPLKQHLPNLNFACSTAGTVALSVTVSDGDPNPSCADTLVTTVRCSAR